MTRQDIKLIEEREGEEWRGPTPADFPPAPDLRLGPMERSKLGARGAVFASAEVLKASNAFNGTLGRRSLIQPQSEGETHIAKVQADELFDALSTDIRSELGAGAKLNLSQSPADDAKS